MKLWLVGGVGAWRAAPNRAVFPHGSMGLNPLMPMSPIE